jgi:hypothetical protein
MKVQKRIVLIIGILLVSSLILNLQSFKMKDSEPDEREEHIMMEIYEIPSYHGKGIHIYYGNGDYEIIPFKPFKEENQEKNGDIIVTTLNRLAAEGYEVTTVSSGLSGSGMITKLFLRK